MAYEQEISFIKGIIKDDSVVVNFQDPPNYLAPFLNEPILFVYKKKEIMSDTIISKCSSLSESECEYTGQPLELSFADDETVAIDEFKTKEADSHFPIEFNDARRLLSMISLELNLTIPLIILTEGTDNSRTIVMAFKVQSSWYTRSWVNLRDLSIDGPSVCNVDDMIKIHEKISLMKSHESKTEVHGKYIMESNDDTNSTLVSKSTSSIDIDLTWTTPSFSIPIDGAAVKLTIRSNIESELPETLSIWNQLILLYEYTEVLKKWKADISTQGLYSRHYVQFPNIQKLTGDEKEVKSVQDQLSQLLRQPNESSRASMAHRATENSRINLENIYSQITSQKEEEFTDRLWIVLIGCSSYEELCTSVDKVFQAVKNGICKPYIKNSNMSRFAEALQCCKNDPNRFSATFEPLELLVEIGIEKLKKEFIAIFLLAKIITAEKLFVPILPKFFEISIAEWMNNTTKWCLWLLRSYTSLQLMIVTEKIIQFTGCIIPLTSSAMKHYHGENSPISELVDPRSIRNQCFNTSINSADIQDLLMRKTPFNSWSLKITSETNNRKVESIYFRDMNDSFPSSVSTPLVLDSSMNNTYESNTFPYHCYDFHSVSDHLPVL